ncbi:hypothetical protein RyT2_26420 [Pseudolactococcus yaeyamensis]
MKKFFKSSWKIYTILACIFTTLVIVIWLVMSYLSQYRYSYGVSGGDLKNLENNHELVIKDLSQDNINASYFYDEDTSYDLLKIEEKNVEYFFNHNGIAQIHIKGKTGNIEIEKMSDSGKIEKVMLTAFSGIDTAKASYNINQISKARAYFWGDLAPKELDKMMKGYVGTNDEIRIVVLQAEQYQKDIKNILQSVEE